MKSDFALLAPLTSRETRRFARQSARLGNWILDSANDALFSGWQGLGQVVPPAPLPESERFHHEHLEREALEHILDEDEEDQATDQDREAMGELGWRPVARVRGERTQTPFGRFLSQDLPPSRPPEVGVTNPSTRDSHSGSEEDTHSVVSQDNHWRRTIFG
jgi:hypothetical protein